MPPFRPRWPPLCFRVKDQRLPCNDEHRAGQSRRQALTVDDVEAGKISGNAVPSIAARPTTRQTMERGDRGDSRSTREGGVAAQGYRRIEFDGRCPLPAADVATTSRARSLRCSRDISHLVVVTDSAFSLMLGPFPTENAMSRNQASAALTMLHELVHVKQYRDLGASVFLDNTCSKLFCTVTRKEHCIVGGPGRREYRW
jgi:hypothetical protein